MGPHHQSDGFKSRPDDGRPCNGWSSASHWRSPWCWQGALATVKLSSPRKVWPRFGPTTSALTKNPMSMSACSLPLTCAPTNPPTPRGQSLMRPTGGTVANTTLRLPSKGKSSTSVENTPSFPMTVAMFGTPTFRALYPMHSAVRLSPPTPEPRGWERAASSKPPTGTSSPCPGSPMLEAT